MLFVAFQEVVAGILDDGRERAKFCEIIEKLLQLCFSDRKFVMSAKTCPGNIGIGSHW
jgi:hypothetical protein